MKRGRVLIFLVARTFAEYERNMFCGCCDDKDDDPEENRLRTTEPAPHVRMARGGDDGAGGYLIAPQGSRDEDENRGDEGCCPTGENNGHSAGVQEFFNRLRTRWRIDDSVAVVSSEEITESEIDPSNPFGLMKMERAMSSPLRTAASFDSSKGIPAISPEQVVLPGSHLQREMARAMSRNLENQDDECVICMEGFDASNPRMPTLCGCGTNKTYFHLPCLYQWIEQCEECPSCRQSLRWEEF